MSKKPRSKLKRVKTGGFERRLSMARAGLVASTRLAANSAGSFFTPKSERSGRRSQALSQQAHYLAEEIGKLKGSIVKIGQMMALYGEHFLPPEVTEALHTLEDDTTALEWSAIATELQRELGERRLALLDIDPEPIGAASIGQVHLATIKATGEQICLKVQYPGVADAVDSDLRAVETLIRVLKVVPITDEFEGWYDEIRDMMYREVDYDRERAKTKRFGQRLADDARYIVPKVYDEFCSPKVLATSYEPGHDIDSVKVRALPQTRRNRICAAALDLCWMEVFEWGEMQTDPNFGNYFVRTHDDTEQDQIVLLDFGAVREFSRETLDPGRRLVTAAFTHDEEDLIQSLKALGFFRANPPLEVQRGLVKLCYTAMEPFADPELHPPNARLLTSAGEYRWGDSKLPARLSKQAGLAAAGAARYFTVPPRELMFLIRKIMGAYTFMTVLNAEIKGVDILEPHVQSAH